jgi:hypothetical protein
VSVFENVECEALVMFMRNGEKRREWITRRVDQLTDRNIEIRCPECKGAARIHKANAKNAPQPHFEHREANPECSRSRSQ